MNCFLLWLVCRKLRRLQWVGEGTPGKPLSLSFVPPPPRRYSEQTLEARSPVNNAAWCLPAFRFCMEPLCCSLTHSNSL